MARPIPTLPQLGLDFDMYYAYVKPSLMLACIHIWLRSQRTELTLDGRKFYFTSDATFRQILEERLIWVTKTLK
jgi:hypothetical protein